jgi:fumarylacetoacetate (FAA) hydrolase family protein
MTASLRTRLTPAACLPADARDAMLIGRLWVPTLAGPVLVRVDGDDLIDLTAIAPTATELFERAGAPAEIRARSLPRIGTLAAALANASAEDRNLSAPWLLAPCDLQAIKAAGVTFVASMLERVIEEQTRGDPAKAEGVRRKITGIIGDNLRSVEPGSPAAARVKEVLLAEGLWSQYLEVGIGPDAEIFTKSQPMSAVGAGADIGIHRRSTWNNPEPEIVLAVNSRGETVGATLGNDVNLRDFEGRSALLLGKAKDNNASCAIGPFVRLFDASFTIDTVRAAEIALTVDGPDGFELQGSSSIGEISRDPIDLVSQAIGPNHQYPDGLMLFLGTMFAPTQDRHGPGLGFTHEVGDVVTIATPSLGALANRVNYADAIAPWTFGAGALMRNLVARRAR